MADNFLAQLLNLAQEKSVVITADDFARKLATLGAKSSAATISRKRKKDESAITDLYPYLLKFIDHFFTNEDKADARVQKLRERFDVRPTLPGNNGLFDYIEGVWLFAHYGISRRDRFQEIPYDEMRVSALKLIKVGGYRYDVHMLGPTTKWIGQITIRDNIGFCSVKHVDNGEEMFFLARFPYNQNRVYRTIWTEGVLLCGARGILHQLNCPIVGIRFIMHRLNDASARIATASQFREASEVEAFVKYWKKEQVGMNGGISSEIDYALNFAFDELERVKENTSASSIAVVVRS